ncbi:hypothetical protein ACS0TY_010794 [Phlomoides rotata]
MIMSGYRIWNPRQFGIFSCNGRKWYGSSSNNTRPPLSRPRFHSGISHGPSSKRFSKFKLLSTRASSSSSLTNDNSDIAGLSFANNRISPAEVGGDPPSEIVTSVAGGVVALGKFDALHIGHRELAIQAAKIGVPYLMSFVGMAEVLGWKPRAPIVAKCDRKRVLSSWAPFCRNITPKEFELQFSQVRNLSPQKFIEKLTEELGVCGVVAGQNYRFGYKAAGDSSDLVRLCKEYGLEARIINSVMDKNQEPREGCMNAKEQGQVSSTRVRHALATGDMTYVSELLGRHHRLMVMIKDEENLVRDRKRLSAPRSCLLNLPPKEGIYENCFLIIGDENVVPCRFSMDEGEIHLEFDELAPHINITSQNLLGIDFGDSKV